MNKSFSFLDTVDQIVSDGVSKGILHLYNDDDTLQGNTITLKGNRVVNFGSCSYLGLEFDERLKNASIEAIHQYGTQFSESRAYVSIKLYKELEDNFSKIFNAHAIVAPTTTLGHIAAIPVLVQPGEAVIIDHQVHNSVQTATNILKAKGIHVELLRHNRMDLLEERIKELRSKFTKIWYMADGIYSMYGDATPVDDVYNLLDKYPELYYYVDDAHGMSCFGPNGRGFVLANHNIHQKMVLATSLAKAFATGGAVLVFPTTELARRVRTCGGPFITSGPMQPATLGAALAASKIHLSEEITSLQEELHDNINFAHLMLKKHKLPVISDTASPVFFIGVSLPKLGYNMIKRMLNHGYYLNLGIFPAVPMKNTGIRFTITRLHTFKQIEDMVTCMAKNLKEAMREESVSMEDIYKAFKLKMPEELAFDKEVETLIAQTNLTLEHYKSITEIDPNTWNTLLGNRGSFDHNGLTFLETIFKDNELPEENWDFDYVIVRDQTNTPVLATFFTTTIWKDDMLAPAAVSQQIELKRQEDPYYLTSKVLMMGSLLTEGEHLFVNKTSPNWKGALTMLFDFADKLQDSYDTTTVALRDFVNIDNETTSFLIDNGYFKIGMPQANEVDLTTWSTDEEYYQSLSQRSRKHFREDIAKHESKFWVKDINYTPTQDEIKEWYAMYMNVRNKGFDINTFPLPLKTFEEMAKNSQWDISLLCLKDEYNIKGLTTPVAVNFCYKGLEGNYSAMVLGLDYTYQKEYKVYKQVLYQVVKRAKKLGYKKVCFGFSAATDKKKVGAVQLDTCAFMQTKENYNLEVIGNVTNMYSSTH